MSADTSTDIISYVPALSDLWVNTKGCEYGPQPFKPTYPGLRAGFVVECGVLLSRSGTSYDHWATCFETSVAERLAMALRLLRVLKVELMKR